MKAREAMAETVGTVSVTDTVRRVTELMNIEGCRSVRVLDGSRLVGVITDRDIVIRCLVKGGDIRDEMVGEIITLGHASDYDPVVNQRSA